MAQLAADAAGMPIKAERASLRSVLERVILADLAAGTPPESARGLAQADEHDIRFPVAPKKASSL